MFNSKNEFLQALRNLKHPKPCQEALDWIQAQPVKSVQELVVLCDKPHWLVWVTARFKRGQFVSWAKTEDDHSIYLTALMAYAHAPTQQYYATLNEKMLADLKKMWLV